VAFPCHVLTGQASRLAGAATCGKRFRMRPHSRAVPSRAVMKQVEGATDRLLISLDFRAYRKDLERMARKSFGDPSAVDFVELAEGLRHVPTFLRRMRVDGRQYASAVASAYSSLWREALGRHEENYARNCASAEQEIESDRELASVMEWWSLESPFSRENMGRMVVMMSRLLSSYELRARYLAGLTCIASGHVYEVRWLVRRSTHQVENMLRLRSKDSWRGLVLGEEYIRVRKAISGRRFKFLPERRAIAFSQGHAPRPSHWHRTCSYAEFAAMVVHAAMWECGWLLGRALEKVELGLLLRTSV